MKKTFPANNWQVVPPSEVGMNTGKIDQAKRWFEDLFSDKSYRVAIVHHGYLVAEWYRGIGPQEKVHITSANKSVLSSTLGIAIEEGKINSADELATTYFPELMDVSEGEGPKAGRWAFPVNENISLRHLICNVSGYMKPNEKPGQIFNYQTNGMCVLSHCIEKAYGLYDVTDPESSPKISPLYKTKIADIIGANWVYTSGSKKMHSEARLDIFGWGTAIRTSLRDLCRLGWLWCQWGNWLGEQVVPKSWMREATVVAPDILAASPENMWRYGHGFWSNEQGKLWPNLPREGFGGWGALYHLLP